MTDWHVRPSGGSYGTEDGTSYDNAWAGSAAVIEASLATSDRLDLYGALGNGEITLVTGGAEGAPMVITGHDDATIDNDDTVANGIWMNTGLSDIHILNVTIKNSTSRGMLLGNNGTGVHRGAYLIQGCTITDSVGVNVTIQGVGCRVIGNYIANSIVDNIKSVGANAVITDNILVNAGSSETNVGDSIQHESGINAYIARNYCDHTSSTDKQAIIMKGDGSVAEDNICLHKVGGLGSALGLFDDDNMAARRNWCKDGSTPITCSVPIAQIISNVCINGSDDGIKLTTTYKTGAVCHNTVVNSAVDGIDQESTGALDIDIYNNIVINAVGIGLDLANNGNTHNATNCCYNNGTDFGQAAGAGSITTDPKLRDVAGEDYRLNGDSPCVAAGTHYGTAAVHGQDGRRFCIPPSMGAYEYYGGGTSAALPSRVKPAGVDISKAQSS